MKISFTAAHAPKIALLTLLACAGCAAEAPRRGEADPDPVLIAARGPAVVATTSAEARSAGLRAARRAAGADEAGGERLGLRAAPFLLASPLGRAFLTLPAPRALALGEPAAFCPGGAVAEGADAAAAAAEALRRCLAALTDRPDCGCALLAVDETLLADRSAFAYAQGVGARLLGVGLAGPLTARATSGAEGARLLLFEDAGGPVAEARIGADGAARLRLLPDGAEYAGRSEPVGWRRGRLRERLWLEGPDGAPALALVGYEPSDVAALAALL